MGSWPRGSAARGCHAEAQSSVRIQYSSNIWQRFVRPVLYFYSRLGLDVAASSCGPTRPTAKTLRMPRAAAACIPSNPHCNALRTNFGGSPRCMREKRRPRNYPITPGSRGVNMASGTGFTGNLPREAGGKAPGLSGQVLGAFLNRIPLKILRQQARLGCLRSC